MSADAFEPLTEYREYSPTEMLRMAQEFYANMKRRRSIREFSDRPVDRAVIEQCLLAAGTAPSGANMQPWHFVVVSDPTTKKEIRLAAEEVEREFYSRRASSQWLEALEPLGTTWEKPFLEKAPYLIAIFTQKHSLSQSGEITNHYYIHESVGIATGMLITALHQAGLCCLTHTPHPMRFLNKILNRPGYESPFLLLVVGYPAKGVTVPVITKKSLADIATFV
jgi:nitroreductase